MKFYTTWWFWVIIGIICLGIIGVFINDCSKEKIKIQELENKILEYQQSLDDYCDLYNKQRDYANGLTDYINDYANPLTPFNKLEKVDC